MAYPAAISPTILKRSPNICTGGDILRLIKALNIESPFMTISEPLVANITTFIAAHPHIPDAATLLAFLAHYTEFVGHFSSNADKRILRNDYWVTVQKIAIQHLRLDNTEYATTLIASIPNAIDSASLINAHPRFCGSKDPFNVFCHLLGQSALSLRWQIGNCQELSSIVAIILMLIGVDFYYGMVSDPKDENCNHGFIMAKSQDGNYIALDPWLEICCAASEFIDKATAMLKTTPSTKGNQFKRQILGVIASNPGLPQLVKVEIPKGDTRIIQSFMNYYRWQKKPEHKAYFISAWEPILGFVLPYIDKPIVASHLSGPKSCWNCGTLGASMKCTGCKIASYCDAKCQRADWKPTHKVFCKTLVGTRGKS